MDTYTENYVRQLQHLLRIVNDGKEGYKKAAEEAHSEQLKEVFTRFSSERQKISEDLRAKISEMGGDPDNTRGDFQGKLHRSWMDIKAALSKRGSQAVLESCKTGDLAALDAYDDVLQGSLLETELKPYLMKQRLLIHQAFLEIDKLYFDLFRHSGLKQSG